MPRRVVSRTRCKLQRGGQRPVFNYTWQTIYLTGDRSTCRLPQNKLSRNAPFRRPGSKCPVLKLQYWELIKDACEHKSMQRTAGTEWTHGLHRGWTGLLHGQLMEKHWTWSELFGYFWTKLLDFLFWSGKKDRYMNTGFCNNWKACPWLVWKWLPVYLMTPGGRRSI